LTLLPPLDCPSRRSGPTSKISLPLHDLSRASPWGLPHVGAPLERGSPPKRVPGLAPEGAASWRSREAVRSLSPDPLAGFPSPSAVSACSTFAALFRAAAVSRLFPFRGFPSQESRAPLRAASSLAVAPRSRIGEIGPAVSPPVSRDVRGEGFSPLPPHRANSASKQESLLRLRCSTRPLPEERLGPTALHLSLLRGGLDRPPKRSSEVPTQPPSGELPRSPDDYGRPFRRASAAPGSAPRCLPTSGGEHGFPVAPRWVRSEPPLESASLRFEAFLLLRVRSRPRESPHAHGRSSLGSFAPLKLSPPAPRASIPLALARARPLRGSLARSLELDMSQGRALVGFAKALTPKGQRPRSTTALRR